MSKGLDLSKFKKGGDDGRTVTLHHPDGHQLKIAKGALSPALRKQVESLPTHSGAQAGAKRFAEGGASDYDAGTTTGLEDEAPPAPPAAKGDISPQALMRDPMTGEDPGQMFGAGERIPSLEQQAEAAPAAPDMDANSPAPPVAGDASLTNPYADYVNNSAEAPAAAPARGAAPQPSRAAPAPASEGVPPPPVFTPQQTATYLKTHDPLFQKDLDSGHIKPETYASLFAKKDTLGKIGTIFGMMLSGAGSGLADQPNVLMTMMQKEIDNDFEAQKQSKTNAYNLLRLNQEHQRQEAEINRWNYENQLSQAHVGNLGAQNTNLAAQNEHYRHANALADAQARDANIRADAAAKMQGNRVALHSLVTSVSKLPPGSPEYMKAQQTLGMLANAVQTENYDIADRAAALSALGSAIGGGGNDGGNEQQFQQNQQYLKITGHKELAEDNEAKHLPGVPGKSSIALTAKDRDQIGASQAFLGSLGRYKQFVEANGGSMNPKTIAEGKALAAQVQGDFRQATNGGVFKEGEQHFIESVIPSDPSQWQLFSGSQITPKIDAVLKETAARRDSHLKSLGFAGAPKTQQPGPPIGLVEVNKKTGARRVMTQHGWKAQ